LFCDREVGDDPGMSDLWRLRTKGSNANAKLLIAQRASRQFGRIGVTQLRELGVPRTTVAAWVAGAYLHPKLPGVYAVGHDGSSTESDLAAALLYAGTGAALSHGTAARVAGWLVDAVWDDRKVVIELDGHRNHRTRAQLNRDHQRDLELRAAGFKVARYTEAQLRDHPEQVAEDVIRLLGS
jgi:very-short-patch-repair endonuclease